MLHKPIILIKIISFFSGWVFKKYFLKILCSEYNLWNADKKFLITKIKCISLVITILEYYTNISNFCKSYILIINLYFNNLFVTLLFLNILALTYNVDVLLLTISWWLLQYIIVIVIGWLRKIKSIWLY